MFHRPMTMLAFAVSLVLAGQLPAHGESLGEAIAAAERGNPGLAAERARQRAATEAVPQAWALGMPEITASFDAGRTEEVFHDPASTAARDPYGMAFTASFPVFRGFRTINGVREARAQVRAGENRVSQAAQALVADVAEAYADVVRDRQVLRLRRDNRAFLADELIATKRRQQLGDQSRTDVAQAEARLQAALADFAQAEADMAASEARFAALVGHLPGDVGPPPLPERALPSSLEAALSLADANNPAIAARREDLSAANYGARVRRGELLPTVTLEASYDTHRDDAASYGRSDETTVKARLSLPLFQGGARLSRIRQAASLAQARGEDYVDTRARTAAEVTGLFHNRQAARARIASARAQVSAAQTALRGVRAEAEIGQRSVIDILDARRDLVGAEIGLADAVRDLTVTSYRLLASIGRAQPGAIAGAPAADAAVPNDPDVPRPLAIQPQRAEAAHERAGADSGPEGILRASLFE